MRNSNIGNISIAIPTESRLKTYSQFDDKSMLINEEDDLYSRQGEGKINFNQNAHLNKWLTCRERIPKKYVGAEGEDEGGRAGSCFMVQLEEFGDFGYRRKMGGSGQRDREKQKEGQAYYRRQQPAAASKIYLKLLLNLHNPQTHTHKSRTLQPTLLSLQPHPQKSPNLYRVQQPNLAIFFHSKLTAQQGYRLRIEAVIVESAVGDMMEIVVGQEYVGYCDVDVWKGLRSRQRGVFVGERSGVGVDAYVSYTVLVSDSFKILQKLLPPNCLCSSQQQIPGLAGRKLPHSITTLHYPIEYTELHSLRLDIVAIDIPDTVISGKIKQAELYARCLYNLQDVTVGVREVRVQGVFHNGWEKFCGASVRVQDKMEIQRKNSKKMAAEVIKIRHYTTEELFNLPFIFVDEEAILLLQVVAKLEIKPKNNSTVSHSLSMPLCYSYYIINKISTDQKVTRPLYIGQALAQPRPLFASPKHECQGSRLEFFLSLQHANKLQLSKHLLTLPSNKSHLNTEADRIQLEKQRMVRENRKLRQMNRVKKIELNQEIPILDTTNFKENLYRGEVERVRQERREKEEMLDYLRRKIRELVPEGELAGEEQGYEEEGDLGYQRVFASRGAAHSYHNSQFYKAILQPPSHSPFPQSLTPTTPKTRPLPLLENPQISKLYQSGQIPLQIIKTQLLQKNYSYGIFINWLSLVPVSPDRRLPRKFYFVASLFTEENLRSCLCTVDQGTGEVVVLEEGKGEGQGAGEGEGEQKDKNKQLTLSNPKTQPQQQQPSPQKSKTKKILYCEIGPTPNSTNNDSIFIEFISYLYHSQLQVRIFDAVSGILFGEVFFRLRDCIRMRRNQVEVYRDGWVRKEGEARAKLKVEIKTIRKQPSPQSSQPQPAISHLESLSMQPQARQLHRITAYKKSLLQPSTLQKIDRLLSTQLATQQLSLRVFRMKGQFLKLQIKNSTNIVESYKIVVNDPDRGYLGNQELVVVGAALFGKIGGTGWWRYLEEIGGMFRGVLVVDQSGGFQLLPGQTASVLLYYYSERKYYANQDKDLTLSPPQQPPNPSSSSSPLTHYNHAHTITLTIHNTNTHKLHSLHTLSILPQADPNSIHSTYIRKEHSKLNIEIPYVGAGQFVVYIDDPTVISVLGEGGSVGLDCVVPGQGMGRGFCVSVLSPFPENRVLGSYLFQVWGACEVVVQGKLWETQDVLIDLHSSICLKKGLQYILVLADDQKTISIRQKNPIKVNHKQAKTIIRLSISPSTIGTSHHELNIVSPIDYSIVYRYVIKLEIREPPISEKITLRIKLTDKMLEEPFGFRNDLNRKQKYGVMTTHPHILWCQQDNLQVQAKSEKKIKIIINAEEVVETEAVILSFLSQKSEIHYLFILELDSQL